MSSRKIFAWGHCWWPGILVIAALDASLLITGVDWKWDWNTAVEQVNGGLFVAAPLVAGLTVHLMSPWREAKGRRTLGIQDSPSKIRFVWSSFATGAIHGLIAHGIVMVTAIVIVSLSGASGTLEPLLLLYGFIPILINAAVGVALGILVPGYLGLGAAIVAGLLLSYASIGRNLTGLLQVGGGFDAVGYTFPARTIAIYWLLAIVTAVLGLSAARAALNTARTASVTLLIAAFVVVIGGSQAGATTYMVRETVVSALDRQICQPGDPTVCLLNGHTRHLASNAGSVRDAAGTVSAMGAAVPEKFIETIQFEQLPEGTSNLFGLSSPNSAPISARSAALTIMNPGNCKQLFSEELTDEIQSLLDLQILLADVVLQRQGLSTELVLLRPQEASAVTDEFAANAYRSLADCRVEADMQIQMGEISAALSQQTQ